jgi:outer membrane protein OmpA-like peptidoglycan-associated protein
MAKSKKAMIEARQARVPLSRVAIELRRADNKIRSRVAGVGFVFLLMLTAGGSFLLYMRPLESVMASTGASAAAQLALADTPTPEIAALPETTGATGDRSVIDLGAAQSLVEKPSQIAEAQAPEGAPTPVPVDNSGEKTVAALAPFEKDAPVASGAETENPSAPEQASSSAETKPAEPDTPAVSTVLAVQPSQPPERIQIAATAPARDIVEIFKPREDTRCTADLKELAEKATLYFPLSSTSVEIEDNAHLKAFASAVKGCPHVRVDVGGHTDKTGEQILNLQLSWLRAENTIKYLRSIGFDTAQFSPVGFSSTRPLYAEQTGLAQAKNRRVEFTVR